MEKRYASSAAESLVAFRTIIATLTEGWPNQSTDDKTEFLPEGGQGIYDFFEHVFEELARNSELAQPASVVAANFSILNRNETYDFSIEARRKFASMLDLPFIEEQIKPTSENSAIINGPHDGYRDMTDCCKSRLPFRLENRRMLIEAAKAAAAMLTRELVGYCLKEDTEKSGYINEDIKFDLVLTDCEEKFTRLYLYCQEGINAIAALDKVIYDYELFKSFVENPVDGECLAAFDAVFDASNKYYAEMGAKGLANEPMNFAEAFARTHHDALIELGFGDLLIPEKQMRLFKPFMGYLDYSGSSGIVYNLLKSIQITILRKLTDDANDDLADALHEAIVADSTKG